MHHTHPGRNLTRIGLSVFVLPATATAALGVDAGGDYEALFRPVFDTNALIWFGGLLWLVLALDLRRLWTLRTLDVLSIIGLMVLFQFRPDDRPATALRTDLSYAYLAATGIFAICDYLFLRTLGHVVRRAPREMPSPGVGATAWVLLAFVIAAGLCTIPRATESVGGAGYLRATGRLPYGQPGQTATDGPLLYTLHAALLPPTAATRPALASTTATAPAPLPTAQELARTRWIAKAGHLLLLLGILALGCQHHSATMGALLASLYGLFAMAAPQLAPASLTVPAALVTWALVGTGVRGRAVGAILSGVLLAIATGVMFYAAVLVPAWLGYYLRRPRGARLDPAAAGVEPVPPWLAEGNAAAAPARTRRDYGALAFAASFVVVIALVAAYAIRKTSPLPPRNDGILARAGDSAPAFTNALTITDGRWHFSSLAGMTRPASSLPETAAARLARRLADDGDSLATPIFSQKLADGVPREEWIRAGVPVPTTPIVGAPQVPLQQIRPTNAEAARALELLYGQAAAQYPAWRRALAAARTVFEAAWFGPADVSSPTSTGGAWVRWRQRQSDLLGSQDAAIAARSQAREKLRALSEVHQQIAIGYAGLVLLLFLGFLAIKSRCTAWHVCAASAALIAGLDLVSQTGGANAAWYLPLAIVTLFAGRSGDPNDSRR